LMSQCRQSDIGTVPVEGDLPDHITFAVAGTRYDSAPRTGDPVAGH
jgi:hypothetical protein